jgi:hypothetical protein
MENKICTKCNIEKTLNNFYKQKLGRFGVCSECKECLKQYRDTNKEKRKTYRKINKEILAISDKEYRKKFPWIRIFSDIKQRCNNPNIAQYKDYGGRGIKCLITPKELKELWFRDKAYDMEQPSIDRIDNDGNYTFENCQFLELVDNIKKDKNKPILQFDLYGNFVKEWDSISVAGRNLKINRHGISKCCSGKYNTCANFIWKFKK